MQNLFSSESWKQKRKRDLLWLGLDGCLQPRSLSAGKRYWLEFDLYNHELPLKFKEQWSVMCFFLVDQTPDMLQRCALSVGISLCMLGKSVQRAVHYGQYKRPSPSDMLWSLAKWSRYLQIFLSDVKSLILCKKGHTSCLVTWRTILLFMLVYMVHEHSFNMKFDYQRWIKFGSMDNIPLYVCFGLA